MALFIFMQTLVCDFKSPLSNITGHGEKDIYPIYFPEWEKLFLF